MQNSCTSRDLLIPQHAAHVGKALARSCMEQQTAPRMAQTPASCALPVRSSSRQKVKRNLIPTWLLFRSCATAMQRHPNPSPGRVKCGSGLINATRWYRTNTCNVRRSHANISIFFCYQALSCHYANQHSSWRLASMRSLAAVATWNRWRVRQHVASPCAASP